MPQLMPVVPLSRPVLFPGMIAHVHFTLNSEVAAIDTHIESQRPLVVVPASDPLRVNPGPADLHTVGCLAQATRVVRLGDGSVRVLLEGIERVGIKEPRPDPHWDLGFESGPFQRPET